ncbi:helix-turn-helix transcriptional regulator [Chryseobacterium sp.]|uniref:helix-turn-helix domain-containing protein n=1 Tax=Chryseobacterium sp. TaxID=1871047 RepID=UPI00289E426A|nr:helix-turn-helix transcriptional regulator [Chryseobacterium sp.]
MGLKKTEQKEYAKFLFTEKNLTQKEIAEKVGVTEKTLAKWISENDNEWKKLKTSLITTKPAQIKSLYEQLERINETIQTRPVVYDVPAHYLKPIKVKNADGSESLEYQKYTETDFPVKIGNFPNSKDSDTIVKITNAIAKLEAETSIGDSVNVGMEFCEFVRDIDFKLAQQINGYFDMFIRQQFQN